MGSFLAMLAVGALLAAGWHWLAPRLNSSRSKGWVINCGGNLKSIGLAMRMFAGDNQDSLPDDLGELMDEAYLTSAKVYLAPGSSTVPPANSHELRSGQTDFEYLGAGRYMDGRSVDEPPGTPPPAPAHTIVLMHTKPGIYRKHVVVLFFDGHVEMVGAPEMSLRLAAGRGWVLPPKLSAAKLSIVLRYGQKLAGGGYQLDLKDKPGTWSRLRDELRRGPPPDIRRLTLTRDPATAELISMIAALSGLEQLDLGGTQLTAAHAETLGGLQNLRELRADCGGKDAARLKLAERFPQLEKLSLRNIKMLDGDLEAIARLTGLRLLDLVDCQVSDAGMIHLAKLEKLESLGLEHSLVADAGLAHLTGLKNLRELDLSHTRIGDAGLAYLSGMSALETLMLVGTGVTDAGLAHLTGLRELQHLCLRQTAVTGLGTAQLSHLPKLELLCRDAKP